jgi:chlorobactene glucosyltransferase
VWHQATLAGFVLLLVLIAVSNLLLMRRLGGDYPAPASFPRVSVLVPARDEEANIERCIRSLLAQNYTDFEVLALDDHSGDGTGRILAALATEDSRLRTLQGRRLPPDWLGKHWACHQLAEAASGELLLFVDADTRHDPRALRDAVGVMLGEDAAFLSALPRQEVVTWAEKLLVPVISWSLLSFLPLALAYRLRTPMLSAAIGQFMLFRRAAYEQIGGHESVRQSVVDDIALGRRVKAAGLRWRLVDGTRRVRCRMYRNAPQVFEGISKNLLAVFGNKIPVHVFVWTWLAVAFVEPLAVLGLSLAGAPVPALSVRLAGLAAGGSLLLWLIAFHRFGYPLFLAFLYPASMLLAMVVAVRSVAVSLTGRATWKGRQLATVDQALD